MVMHSTLKFPGNSRSVSLVAPREGVRRGGWVVRGDDGALDNLLALSMSYRTAPVEIRERFSVSAEAAPSVLGAFMASGVEEALIVSTCNRTEFYLVAEDEAAEAAAMEVIRTCYRGSFEDVLGESLWFRGRGAALHLMRVACGLDSMIVGEAEVQGQVRAAVDEAKRAGSMGPCLGRLAERALIAGKRARHTSGLGAFAASVATAAVSIVERHAGQLSDRTVLLIGAGRMGSKVARALVPLRPGRVLVANRTSERSHEVATLLTGEVLPIDNLAEGLAAADVVFVSTGAPHAILSVEDVGETLLCRQGRPLVISDISVPRNVDPEVARLPGVTLVDIDDLRCAMGNGGSAASVDKAELIASQECHGFLKWAESREAISLVTMLRCRADKIRQDELNRTFRRLRDLSPEERARVESLTRAVVNKILHHPTVYLRRHGRIQGTEEIFGLLPDILSG